jgi:hypothetical protein
MMVGLMGRMGLIGLICLVGCGVKAPVAEPGFVGSYGRACLPEAIGMAEALRGAGVQARRYSAGLCWRFPAKAPPPPGRIGRTERAWFKGPRGRDVMMSAKPSQHRQFMITAFGPAHMRTDPQWRVVALL